MSSLILVAAFMVGPLQVPAASATQAQTIYKAARVEGRVVAADGSPLPGVTVSTALVNTSTTVTTVTNADGRYVLPEVRIIKGELNLFFSLQGFGNQTVSRFDVVDRATVDVTLQPAFLTQLSVGADIPMLSTTGDVGVVTLAPSQIAVLPSLGERDLFRAFQLLPGVSGSNETSSGLYVRGGTPDQNAILLDGFRVYHVDHLFGYFSAFNMDAIDNVALHKGGFDAKFGGAVSGIMEIDGRSGHLDDAEGSFGGSLLGFHGHYERPLSKHASFLIAARRSFQGPLYNKILGLVNNSGPRPGNRPPRGPAFVAFDSQPSSKFYDVNTKLTLKPGDADEVAFTVYGGGDDVDNSRDLQLPTDFIEQLKARGINLPNLGFDTTNPSLNIADVRETTNLGVGLVWARKWNGHVSSRVNVGYSRFEDTRDRHVGGTTQSPSGERDAMKDLTFRVALPVEIAVGHTLEAGLEHTANHSNYSFLSGRPGDPSSTPLDNVFDQSGRGVSTSAYIQDRWLIGSRLFLAPGIRLTQYDQTGKRYADPRFSTSFVVNKQFTLKAATGRYHQFSSRVTREDVLQGNREFWTVADGSLVPVVGARDFVGGGSYQRGSLLVDVEGFSRNTTGITQFAPRISGGSESIDYASFFYHGNSTSRGVDVLVQKKTGRHTGWISYTANRVTYHIPDLQANPFPADHDRPHEAKAVSVLAAGHWTLSTTFVLASGRPYTEPVGTESLTIGDLTLTRVVVGEKNGERLPEYHRVDFALNRRVPFGFGREDGLLNFTIFNVFNRHNVWYKEFNAIDGSITENNIRSMGLTLNASFSVKF